ncbi:MAG: hypothetical protein Kow0069_23090 [Promethearchaeota archaeon]
MEKIRSAGPTARVEAIKKQLLHDLKRAAETCAEEGDLYEAAEILHSAAYLFEEVDFTQSQELYLLVVKYWTQLAEDLRGQGNFREVAELHRKVGQLLSTKFNDSDASKEHYLEAIRFSEREALIDEQFGEVRKLAADHLNIAELHATIHDWEKAVSAAKLAGKFALEQGAYDIFAAAVELRADALSHLKKFQDLRDCILEAVNFFSLEGAKAEEEGRLFAASQAYNVLKRLNRRLPNVNQYKYFTIKEAGTYVALAECQLMEGETKPASLTKVANYYRGAGLCYAEVEYFQEAAASFHLASQYYEMAGDIHGSAVNRGDAARFFTQVGSEALAWKLFVEAGERFEQIGLKEDAVENLMAAYELHDSQNACEDEQGESKSTAAELATRVAELLSQLALEQLGRENYHLAGTLYLEAARFHHAARGFDKRVSRALRQASRAFTDASSLQSFEKPSQKPYARACASLTRLLLGDVDKARRQVQKAREELGSALHGEVYMEVAERAIEMVEKRRSDSGGEGLTFPSRLRRAINRSTEIKKLLEYVEWTYFSGSRSRE